MRSSPSTTELRRPASAWDTARAITHRLDVGVAALWLVLAGGLAAITSQVADWYVMTDELLYERLAISAGHLHSPLPYIHGELIGNVNQLYPLLLAPLFYDRLVPAALHDAHILNAFVMSSASIPAFLLARRLMVSRWLAYLVAALSVCIPWIALSSFLMTEVVAYPVFLWAVLALHHAAVSPRFRNDVGMVVAISVAIFARTQLAVFLVVVPVALFVHQLALAQGRTWWSRLRAAGGDIVAAHRALAAAYAALVLVGLALLAVGRLSDALGTYSVTAEGDLLPSGMGRSLLEHLAPLGLGLGIVPFVAGLAWLLATLVSSANRERHAFAAITTVMIAALLVEVTSYDLRFGQGRLHDRYLFYVVPLVLVAFAALVQDRRLPRWPLLAAGGLLAMAFAFMPIVRFQKFNVDSPVAAFNDPLLDLTGSVHLAQLLLAFVAIAATLLIVLLRPRQMVVLLVTFAALALPAQTGLAYARLFTKDGTSGRPLTLDQGVVFDWIDREVGPAATVTMIPYPFLYGNYWENVAYWWNVEFWNASVNRAAVYESAFTGTPETFPKISLSFDRSTGQANVSSSTYVVQGIAETRFRLAGDTLGEDRGIALVEAERPWRAEWLAFDLYRDGWTIPKVDGTIRVFAAPGQSEPLRRFLTISIRGPQNQPARGFHVSSNSADWRGKAGEQQVTNQVAVCVPPRGYGDLRISAPRFTPIYGDPRSEESFVSYARSGGVLITGIALADETAPC